MGKVTGQARWEHRCSGRGQLLAACLSATLPHLPPRLPPLLAGAVPQPDSKTWQEYAKDFTEV